MTNNWYVAQTQINAEARARQHLINQGFEVFLPVYARRRRHARKVDTVLRPLFPRYLFVRLDLEKDRWRSVNGTVGITHLITQGDSPVPVPQPVMAELMARADPEGVVTLAQPELRPGDQVRLEEGPFSEFVGVFEAISEDDRVMILLNLMGRQVRVRASRDSVTSV